MNDETLGQRAKVIVDKLSQWVDVRFPDEEDDAYDYGPIADIPLPAFDAGVDAIVRLAIEYAEERLDAYLRSV